MKERKAVAKQVKRKSKKRIMRKEKVLKPLVVPSGDTLLNLECSDTSNYAYRLGSMINLIADSFTGKTLLALTMCAECAHLPFFDTYDLIYDQKEPVTFNVSDMFGQKTTNRLLAPKYIDGVPTFSNTVQDFKRSIFKKLHEGKPFIYVLDSLDALTEETELKRVEKEVRTEKEEASFKTEKARAMSELLRVIEDKISNSNSLILIISQTRQNLTPMSYEKKKRSGGDALTFYCSHVIWLIAKKAEKKKEITSVPADKRKEHIIGTNVMAKTTKNTNTGKRRSIDFIVYNEYGIDSIGSCINFLIEKGVWALSKSSIIPKGISDTPMTRDKLIRYIEDNKLERRLKKITEITWLKIEESLKLNRKRKFE